MKLSQIIDDNNCLEEYYSSNIDKSIINSMINRLFRTDIYGYEYYKKNNNDFFRIAFNDGYVEDMDIIKTDENNVDILINNSTITLCKENDRLDNLALYKKNDKYTERILLIKYPKSSNLEIIIDAITNEDKYPDIHDLSGSGKMKIYNQIVSNFTIIDKKTLTNISDENIVITNSSLSDTIDEFEKINDERFNKGKQLIK